MRASGIAAFLLAASLGSRSGEGHDLLPPAWRGVPGATSQRWEFVTSGDAPPPDVADNPYGSPTAAIEIGAFGAGWLASLPGLGTQTGLWDLGAGGTATFSVPSAETAGGPRLVHVQVVAFVDITVAPEVVIDGAEPVETAEQVVETVQPSGQWILHASTWRVDAAPADLSIVVTGDRGMGSLIDQVVIDTRIPGGDYLLLGLVCWPAIPIGGRRAV